MQKTHRFSWFVLIPVISIAISITALAQTPPPAPDKNIASWNTARAELVKMLAEKGIQPLDIEQPKWFENFYSTIGRMPLVDEAMAKPLAAPEIAMYFDDKCKQAGKPKANTLYELFLTANEMANMARINSSPAEMNRLHNDIPLPPDIKKIVDKISVDKKIPDLAKQITIDLISATSIAQELRKQAFANLTKEEIERIQKLLPEYFLQNQKGQEVFRAYTATSLDDCVELVFLVQKVDFEKLLKAAEIMAYQSDMIRQTLSRTFIGTAPGILFEAETSIGRIVVGGTDNDIYKKDCAVLLDLGGDDVYLNNAGGTSPTGLGAAILLDVSGNDTYKGNDFCQGAAYGGIGVLIDLAGNDTYISRNYSQCATLLGFSMFFEGGGDDTYTGNLGNQSFAIFGYSIMAEQGGNDIYRTHTMGQSFASTLGIAILAEAEGNDTYVSGGKPGYGFYTHSDSSATQGAASGMRPWPSIGKLTVYGGVALISEAKGNDRYNAHSFAQGGAYIFALGMAVDSEGNDIYLGDDYTQGAGCHVAAGVLVDRAGNDVYRATNHSTGHALDRSVGVLFDANGNDVYNSHWGIGYAGKPRGCAVFVDANGNDTYDGNAIIGHARPTYGEHIHSTTLFLDMAGKDKYPVPQFKNNHSWQQEQFGLSRDYEAKGPNPAGVKAWTPDLVEKISNNIDSHSTLVRFNKIGALLVDGENSVRRACELALQSSNRLARRDMIDILDIFRIYKKIVPADAGHVATMLKSTDRDVRLIACRIGWLAGLSDEKTIAEFGNTILNDKSFEVRSMAAMVLGSSRKKSALEPLKNAAKDPHWLVKRRVAIGLGIMSTAHPEAAAVLYELLQDKDYQARCQAARALGIANDKNAIKPLLRALKDKSEFVRMYAALSLTLNYKNAKGVPALIKLMEWKNNIVLSESVLPVLKSLSGESLANAYNPWKTWWAKNKKTFNLNKAISAAKYIAKAQNLQRQKKNEEAIYVIRDVLKDIPGHKQAISILSDALNQAAWRNAVKGADLEDALKMAEEAVKLSPTNTAYLDTLSVLQYLNGDKDSAINTIQRAIDAEKNPLNKGLYEARLKEFLNGNVKLK